MSVNIASITLEHLKPFLSLLARFLPVLDRTISRVWALTKVRLKLTMHRGIQPLAWPDAGHLLLAVVYLILHLAMRIKMAATHSSIVQFDPDKEEWISYVCWMLII